MWSLFVLLIYREDLKYIKKEDLAVPLKERLSISLPIDIMALITLLHCFL